MRDSLPADSIPQPATNTHRAKYDAVRVFLAELCARRIWAITQDDVSEAKSKAPRYFEDGSLIQSDEDFKWGTFDEAFAAVESGFATGLGFRNHRGDMSTVVDLDDVICENGSLHPAVLPVLPLLANCAYVERSRSGKGLHAILAGTWPEVSLTRDKKRPRGKTGKFALDPSLGRNGPTIEVFWSGQFTIITGDIIDIGLEIRPADLSAGGDETEEDATERLVPLYQFVTALEATSNQPSPTTEKVPLHASGYLSTDAKVEERICEALGKVGLGAARNPEGFLLARQIQSLGVDDETLLAHMLDYHARVIAQYPELDPASYTIQDVRNTVRGVLRQEPLDPPRRPGRPRHGAPGVPRVSEKDLGEARLLGYRLNDTGNAQRFLTLHGENVRYVAASKEWYIWNTRFWELDTVKGINELAKRTAEVFGEEVRATFSEDEDSKEATKIAKIMRAWAQQSGNAARLSNALEVASSDPLVATTMKSFDSDPLLLNCQNGTLELHEDGRVTFREHRREDMLTRTTACDYDPTAKSPLLEGFLDFHLPERDIRDFYFRVVGYALTGLPKRKVVICRGITNSGKSTLGLGCVRALGTYATAFKVNTLQADRPNSGGAPRTDIMSLVGHRFAVASEIDPGTQLSAGVIKGLSGADLRKERGLYEKHETEIQPMWLAMLAVNDMPILPADDPALWERLLVIPFNHYRPDGARDDFVAARVVDPKIVGSTLLNYILRGWTEYCTKKWSDIPEAVLEATKAYREELDTENDFYEQFIVFTDDPNDRVRASRISEEYRAWRRGKVSRRELAELNTQLVKRGAKPYQSSTYDGNRKQWAGIRLIRSSFPFAEHPDPRF